MTVRYYILEGDTTTAGGIVQKTTNTLSFKVYGKEQSYIGDDVWCPACQSMGKIIPDQDRLSTKVNGRMPALNDDLCLCKCTPPPKLVHSQTTFKEIIDGNTLAQYQQTQGQTEYIPSNQYKGFNLRFQVRNNIGNPIVGKQYLLISEFGEIYFGVTDKNGYTEQIYKDKEINFDIHIFDDTLEV